MSRAVAAKPFLRQPAYATGIDRSHPIGKKVTAAISAHYGPSIRIIEMVSGVPATVAAGAVNSVVAGPGRAFRPSTTSSGVYWPAKPAFCDGSQPFSIEVLFTYLGSDSQYSRLLDFGSANGASNGGWDFEIDGTTSTLNFTGWASGANSVAVLTGMTVGVTYHLVITSPAGTGVTSNISIYANAVRSTGTINQGFITANGANIYYATYRTAGDLSAAGMALHLARFYHGSELTPNEVMRLYQKPFEMFAKPRRIFANSVAASGITGTASVTEAADTLSSAGVITLQATASITEANDVLSSTSVIALQGTLTATETDDSLSSASVIAIAGSAAITEGGDSLSATGALAIQATLSVTEADDTLSASNSASRTGDLFTTEDGDSISAAGALSISGTLSVTEAGDSISSAGAVSLQGTLANTEGSDTLSAAATLAIAAALAGTEAGDALAATGAVTITGTLSVTEQGDTLSSTESLPTYIASVNVTVRTYGSVDVATRTFGSASISLRSEQ